VREVSEAWKCVVSEVTDDAGLIKALFLAETWHRIDTRLPSDEKAQVDTLGRTRRRDGLTPTDAY
jgi:hypothetical protein